MTCCSVAQTQSVFADILPMLDHIPPAPPVASAPDLTAQLDRYHVKAGPLLDLLLHLKRWQKNGLTLSHPRICLFAAAYDAPANAVTKTQDTLTQLQGDTHPLKAIATGLNTDLRIYELDLTQQERSAQQAAQAMIYGMLAIEDKGDAIVIGSLSEGAEHAAQQIDVQTWPTDADDLLHALAMQSGLDVFAALGACLAARLAGQPVLLCGAFGAVVKAVLERLAPAAAAHVYEIIPFQAQTDMPPLFATLQNLQQVKFLLAFLPTPKQHVKLV